MPICDDVPPLVARALRFSLEQGYLDATRTETGRLLATLAATCSGPIADCGTGCGVGAAWLRTGAPHGTAVVSAEVNPQLVEGAREVFGNADLTVSCSPWTDLASHGPFSLIFLDRRTAEQSGVDPVWEMTAPRGMIVIDDFPDSPCWPPTIDGRVDHTRMAWLTDSRLIGTSVKVADDTAVLVCVRSE